MKIPKEMYETQDYLRPGDLKGGEEYTIQNVVVVTLKSEARTQLSFKESPKLFTLNKTNTGILVTAWTDETNSWINKKLGFNIIKVQNPDTKQMQDGIQVKPLDAKK